MTAVLKVEQKEYTYFERLSTDAILYQEKKDFTFYL